MTRLEAIEKAGIEALGTAASPAYHRLVRAFAAMIHMTVDKQRPKQKKERVELDKLPYGPGDVFKKFEEYCSEIIQLYPYEKGSFGRLGRVLTTIQGLEEADLDRVTQWVQSGGLATWPTQVTWNHVVKHYSTWVGYARAWEAKGGSIVSGHHGADWR